MLIDLPPGTADLQQLVAKRLGLAGVIIVVTPQDVAHLDAKKALTMFRTAKVRVLGGVENMGPMRCPCCDAEIEVFPRADADRAIWTTVEHLVTIPLLPQVAQGGEDGVPVTVSHPAGPVARAFLTLAEAVESRLGIGVWDPAPGDRD